MPTDPIEYLPSELWLQILEEAIQESTDTSLLLTMVSKRWRSAIITSPSLWTRIILGDGDSWMVKSHVQQILSKTLPLDLKFEKIMTPQSLDFISSTIEWTRVKKIAMLASNYIDNHELRSQVAGILNDVRTFPVLEELYFGSFYTGCTDENTISYLPDSPIRTIKGVHLSLSMAGLLGKATSLETCISPVQLLPILVNMPNLTELQFLRHDFITHVEVMSEESKLALESSIFPSVMSLLWQGAASPVFFDLMRIKGHKLHSLTIGLTWSEVTHLFELLRFTPLMETITIFLQATISSPVYLPPLPPMMIKTLAIILVVIDPGFDLKLYDGLWNAIPDMFPALEDIKIVPASSKVTSKSLEHLQTLRRLYLPIPFPTTEHDQPLESILMSNLEELTAHSLCAIAHNIKAPKLKSFEVYPYIQAPSFIVSDWLESILDKECFPNLQRLQLISPSPRSSFRKLSRLTNIVFTRGKDADFTLFLELILRRPSTLPQLESIESATCQSWDILFLMLLRRNFSQDRSLQYIKQFTFSILPSIRILVPLVTLLSRKVPSELSLYDVSYESSIEILSDPSVPGCYSCIIGHKACAGQVFNIPHLPYGDQQSFPLEDQIGWESPLPSESLRRWVENRETRIEAAEEGLREFKRGYTRDSFCHRYDRTDVTAHTLSDVYFESFESLIGERVEEHRKCGS